MPRIRSWHRVAHDFNRDPEVRELRRRYGDWMALVWEEMLAIADRKGGRLKGDRASIAESLAHVSLSAKGRWAAHKILTAIPYMADKGWIEVYSDHIIVVKYAEFRGSSEHIEIPKGKRIKPLLDKTRLEEKRLDKEEDAGTAPKPPQPAPDVDPFIKECLEKTEFLKCLSNGKQGIYWKTMEKSYDHYPFIYFEDEIKKADAWCAANPAKRPTERGMPNFFRSWLERAAERGRKQHGKT